jgi:two-component system phosphate regulon sensor histidine kinase PhoR
MNSTWASLLLRMSAVAIIALSIGAWAGAAIGWAAACVALAVMLVVHIVNLARLREWLKSPGSRDIPEAPGAWGGIFIDLYRAQRDEKRAREALRQELDLFVQGVEALQDGVAMLDRGDHLLWCNSAAREQLGLDTTDYGLRVINLVRAPGLAEFIARAQGGKFFRHQPPQKPDQVLAIEILPYGDGRKLLVSVDVTQIERADTTRRDFIANVSHELRTPLTVVHGFLEHVSGDSKITSEATRRHLALIAQQSDRMLRLVDDLLMLSRLEGGDHMPSEEAIDMQAMMEAIAEDARVLSAGRHTIEMQADTMPLKGARDELRSAFGNLASNAVRYTPAGGRIELRWERDALGRGVYRVIDSGIGIAAEHIPRLTERFYRVDRSRSRESGGTGLGLAIVKHVLIRHQAVLEIESEPGKGSEFRAAFPDWRCVARPVLRAVSNA